MVFEKLRIVVLLAPVIADNNGVVGIRNKHTANMIAAGFFGPKLMVVLYWDSSFAFFFVFLLFLV